MRKKKKIEETEYDYDAIFDETLAELKAAPELLLLRANELIYGEKEIEHGHPKFLFAMIAEMWTAYTRTVITPRDVALMMAMLKIARSKHNQNVPDHMVDCAGYVGLTERL